MTASATRVIILKEDEVIERMSCLIEDVEIVVHLNKSEIRVLLHHFSWNKNALLDAVAEDEEGTFKAFGLQKQSSSTKPVPVRNKCALAMCQICYKTILRKDMDNVCHVCDHPFCMDCWFQYLKHKISIDKICIGLECPMTSCKNLVEETFVFKVFKESPHILAIYKTLLCESFVYKSDTLRYIYQEMSFASPYVKS